MDPQQNHKFECGQSNEYSPGFVFHLVQWFWYHNESGSSRGKKIMYHFPSLFFLCGTEKINIKRYFTFNFLKKFLTVLLWFTDCEFIN